MKRTIVITGAASGIGRATAEKLTAEGHRVIGVDLRDVEVVADLSTPAGRQAMAAAVASLAPDGVDSVIAVAGAPAPAPAPRLLAINYFGAVATFELLRPLLLRSKAPRAVAIVSTASLSEFDPVVVDACLAGDEGAALALAQGIDPEGGTGYASSKNALARWLRRAAISPEWAGSGILLNGVSPGRVYTPMTAGFFASKEGLAMLDRYTPIALSDCPYGQPEELAEAIAFLATLQGRYLLGQILYVDGGTEAISRTDMI
ncbi:SDR family oxidoreductase [Novosphingobium taihuense]|uniref:NAD(P)-dependent dehydrogenase (Short-subunit alcohol dehydrogenase family) n=1 Tax=Novosphingobium taihuense TaxID=260085 RepID=A0A7W7ACB4_9SPHN|nr:SDR family oxidoreductase [Novosphingobium taihuense]MBB4614317.1 NAD(P)-dependent dehydrogenase (short-subunit alcohol dehydrogenase family) [Novosphingobium taihuense]TWH87163.1 NAD(P)-dependent dehydrogenase (short-subunit alcohol dehydrogenase family) [Novosphingobium taihuense]